MLTEPKSNFYSMVNPDDHDHILVDPKYRMERSVDGERVHEAVMENFQRLEDAYYEQYGQRKKVMSRQVYENLVEAEIAIKNLDRHFAKIQKFNFRRYLDPKNHDRREKRMLERLQEREGK